VGVSPPVPGLPNQTGVMTWISNAVAFTMAAMNNTRQRLCAGMVGTGMIFDDTYRPFFERVYTERLYDRSFGEIDVVFAAAATRTGRRAEAYRNSAGNRIHSFASFTGDSAVSQTLETGTHLLVEKPSVLSLQQLDELTNLAQEKNVLAKVVYHKLLDPDHKKLRTFVVDGVLRHVNSGYCTLLEPKQISGQQFAQWISGRNPGTYVAVHYIKLIDFTFGGRLKTVTATGQRGLIGPSDGPTWDSCQLRLIYEYDSGREAAFDLHTSWVTPDNFPGYVEQEVQFRFDNGIWNGHSRKRGVECTVEGKTPCEIKMSLNNHYSSPFVEPWGERTQRGYGVEAIERFVREVAYVEFGGRDENRSDRLQEMQALTYNDLAADRQTVAAVQALEAILDQQYQGEPDCVVRLNDSEGGLDLYHPGSAKPDVLYEAEV